MSVSPVAAAARQPAQVQPHSHPEARDRSPKPERDQVQISSTAKELHAKAAHRPRGHHDD